jgi:transcription-repair coupling factor (superfamily II helicase)
MLLNEFSDLPLPSASKHVTFGSLLGCSLSLHLANIAILHSGVLVVLVSDTQFASKLEIELKFFLSKHQTEVPVLTFPDWETLPYDIFSPHHDIISERLMTLCRLPHLSKGVLLVPIATLMHRLCPPEYLLQNTVWLRKGQLFQLTPTRKRLLDAGYHCVPAVMAHGEFAVRGSILDLFPMGSEHPFRIDLFGDEIDSIRQFDVETQRSSDKIEEVKLLPAREFPLTVEAISAFRTQFRMKFEGDPTQCSLYLDVSDGNASPGLEYYLPLFFEKTSHLFEYLPKTCSMILVEDLEAPALAFWGHVKERYEQYRHDRLRPILEPKTLFFQPTEVFAKINHFPKIILTKENLEKSEKILTITALPPLFIEARAEKPLVQLAEFLATFKGAVLFCAESTGRREVLKELLANIGCRPVERASWSDFLSIDTEADCSIIIAPLEEGVILKGKQGHIAIITESALLGQRVMQRRLRKTRHQHLDREVQSLAELTIGALVVHVDYGIGRYLGLTRLNHSGAQEGEFVTLEYAGGDKLYVPVAALQVISRYSGADLEHVPLHRLGTDQWLKAKRKAILQARDVAAELLEIYAKRSQKHGFAFPKPDAHYEAFCAEFPFEETPDQQKAIEAVISDLVSDKPMDRVVCGDVGFGKTEVALRAAFMAVYAEKQVAVLVPTTLLAEQHYQTFTDRFSEFPFKVEVLSRFRTGKEQESIYKRAEEGKIDVLIGTHKILQDKLKFKSLGLLIIDEEHRFGVNQKEAFKALRAEIDILTLTATPIPRTLNMAMSGMRDLSIIATPPARRLSVKTFVRERHFALITEAITRELHRGGQVYFLHNAVESIEREARALEALIPTARIAVAHGQMHERALEQVMTDFYHRRHNVLVCTTIIETGIDIPTANTIIIDRADKFGLAQLHQLRGRVGRSHHQAYAFCLIPPKAKISSDATKRLEALVSLEELGSGFTLATQDLEIRGAGELLGDAQSGNIQSIGFQLYMELLEEAVASLKKGAEIDSGFSFKKGVEIDLQISALLPESYIPDVHTRLVLYKRIANAKQKEILEDLSVELIDRFGMLPEQAHNLFKTAELRLQAEVLGICKIEAGPKGGRFEFGSVPRVDPGKIIHFIQQMPNVYSLEGPQKFRFKLDLSNIKTRVQEVRKLMDALI